MLFVRTTLLAALLSLALAASARAEDTAAPVLVHTPVTTAPRGPVKIAAKCTDESKFFPQVFFRYSGHAEFEKPLDMKRVRGGRDHYEATVPFKADSFEYYVEAYDEFGNGPARAGSPDQPFKVTLEEAASALAPPPSSSPSASAKTPPAPASSAPAAAPAPAVSAPAPAPAATAAAPPASAPSPAPARSAPPLRTAAAAPSGGGRTWTWVVGGTGLGLLAGGLVAGLAVKTADDAYKQNLAAPQSDAAALQAQYDANKSLGTKATILTIAGGTLLAAGIVLFFVEGPSEAPRSAALAPAAPASSALTAVAVPLEHGGAVAVAGRF